MNRLGRFGVGYWSVCLLFLVGAGAAQEPKTSPAKPGTAAEPEITIRNVTQRVVQYSIELDEAKPAEKSIQPDAIDRYPVRMGARISFRRGNESASYSLDRGRPYSFRHDNQGRVELYLGAHGRSDAPDLAPYLPTPMEVVDALLEFGQVRKDDRLFDLGCGDGRIIIRAAQRLGTKGTGIDIDPVRIAECREGAKKAQVEHLVNFRLQDATKVDLSSATVVGLYLLSESNAILRPIMEKQLKPGTRVVCHDYPVPGWKETDRREVEDTDGKKHTLYLYIR